MIARGSDSLTVVLISLLVCPAQAVLARDQEFPVTTEPPGAAVTAITGELGTTPLTVSERAIYPNTFAEAEIDRYGSLTFSRPGCRPLTRQITVADIERGVHLQLDCDASARPTPIEDLGGAERSLRQLQVVAELLEDGLITAEEEQAIRRRILARERY